jgi:hypothetical protein
MSFIIGGKLSAQTASTVLKKVNQTYDQKAYKMGYEVTGYYIDKPVYHYKGEVVKSGTQQLNKSDYELTLINKKYFLHLNHEQKIVVFNTLDKKKSQQKVMSNVMESLDSIIEASKPQMTKTSYGYQIALKQTDDPYYENIILKINPEYQLIGVNYYTRTTDSGLTQIEIVYRDITISDQLSDQYFNVEEYVTITKNQLLAKEKYSTYEIIDQRLVQKMN